MSKAKIYDVVIGPDSDYSEFVYGDKLYISNDKMKAYVPKENTDIKDTGWVICNRVNLEVKYCEIYARQYGEICNIVGEIELGGTRQGVHLANLPSNIAAPKLVATWTMLEISSSEKNRGIEIMVDFTGKITVSQEYSSHDNRVRFNITYLSK